MKTKEKIFSLGYEKKNIDEYINLLLAANVTMVADVRETPWSHKRDFCKTAFSQALAEKGIGYVHVPQAGNPKALRKNAAGNVLELYQQYLEKTEAGIPELETILDENQHVCLTCFEKDYNHCHRSVIIQFLEKRHNGRFEVVRLGEDLKLEF